MKQATTSIAAATRWILAGTVACSLWLVGPDLSAQTPATAATGFSALRGTVVDSIHSSPLANASVVIEGTTRVGRTDTDGRYFVDSIPAGPHRVTILHALLDTLGLSMRTEAYSFAVGRVHDLDVPIPGPERVAAAACTSSPMRTRGPAAMIGFVRDADTREPAKGAKVELVFDEKDIVGRKQTRVRSDIADSTGVYRICGLPGDLAGKVQVFRNGISSGEVPAEITNGFLALRAFSIVSQHQTVVEVKGDSGKVRRFIKGSARVTGRVVDKKGQPLREARVTLQGGGTPVLTRPNGEFTLDSLPSGTQALEVRKLGYAVTEVAVELSSAAPTNTTIVMSDAIPLLATVRVEAAQDKALSDLGYISRKQQGQGYFMDGKDINHESMKFSDVMRMAPGIKVMPTGDGRTSVITDNRNPNGGCVNFYVDNQRWTTMTPGDIDDFVRPQELVAIEVYHGSQTPPQFVPPGQSSCATIVAWTQARVSTMSKKK